VPYSGSGNPEPDIACTGSTDGTDALETARQPTYLFFVLIPTYYRQRLTYALRGKRCVPLPSSRLTFSREVS